ncbi:MAG: carbohydrate ABC transporter substrate-binding protein [Clostridiales bacterium]|nr:carbohydrate ABC transporter substrate-binding protein [Clostridiales bacterium]
MNKGMYLRKMISLALILMMVLSTGVAAIALDTSEDIGTVRNLTNVTGGKDDEEMLLFAEAFGKGINGTVIMEKPAANYGEVMMNKLNAGEEYDLLYVSLQELYDMQADEILTDLTDWVKESAVLGDPEVMPTEEWEQLTIDGRIWGSFNKTEVHRVPAINKVIADKAGVNLDEIEPTLDGYHDLFKKLQAVGGDNFYAFNTHIPGLFDLQPWFAAVDLKMGFAKHDDDSLYVPIATEAAIPVWEWFAQLYKEGLMDPDALINTTGDMRNKMMAGQTGLVVDWAAWVGLYNVRSGENYPDVVNVVPLGGVKNSKGDFMLSRGDPSIWVMPINSPNPEGAFRALEFMATQEGGQLFSIGIEGHDYNMQDGKVVMTEIGISHGNDHGAPVPASHKYVSPVPLNPGFAEAMEFLPYGSLDMSTDKSGTYKEIVAKYGTEIIIGNKTAAEGIEAMQTELKERGVI